MQIKLYTICQYYASVASTKLFIHATRYMLHVCMKRVTCIHIIDLQRPLYGAINFNQDRLSPTSKYFVSDCQTLSTGVSEQQSNLFTIRFICQTPLEAYQSDRA